MGKGGGESPSSSSILRNDNTDFFLPARSVVHFRIGVRANFGAGRYWARSCLSHSGFNEAPIIAGFFRFLGKGRGLPEREMPTAQPLSTRRTTGNGEEGL